VFKRAHRLNLLKRVPPPAGLYFLWKPQTSPGERPQLVNTPIGKGNSKKQAGIKSFLAHPRERVLAKKECSQKNPGFKPSKRETLVKKNPTF